MLGSDHRVAQVERGWWATSVGPSVADGGDDQLVTGEPHPDPSVDELMRHRVAHPLDRNGGVPVDPPGGAECDGERPLGQAGAAHGTFLGQGLLEVVSGLPEMAGPPVGLGAVWRVLGGILLQAPNLPS